MSDAAVARNVHELQFLESLVDCAKTISLAIGEAAKVETDRVRQLALFDAFQRGFSSVRMGIRLALTLRAGPRPVRAAPSASASERPDTERLETERMEAERPETLQIDRIDRERLAVERERDREYEPVSLPNFLKALGVVSAAAARLDDLPAHVRNEALPTLNRLLARAQADSAPVPAQAPPSPAQASPAAPKGGVGLLLRPPKAAPRSRWLGSTATVLPKPLPLTGPARARPPPRRSG